MARYFSTDEAAGILGTSERTVRRMLSSGRLPGSQTMDKGKLVWRVHASKEILEKLPVGSAEAEAVIDIDEAEELNFEPDAKPGDWHAQGQAQANTLAEQFWNELGTKFMERIELKDQLIGSLQQELEDKDRQLKLLPDLEKRAADERKAAEMKDLEAEALRKQIAALEESKAAEVEAARIRAEELAAELLRANEEKVSEAAAASAQIAELTVQVADLQRPWWKKIW